ncbi:hypothetical protein IB268_30330 [Achromobacter sp. ACM01]|uniref:hypothetical protein n=1 Tax=Achromobacter sp. ACM01 TaxID=2769298 RepID=UPI001780ED4A|nr:hypothetical protein [Achromobacter sp. ACM01]MBD9477242.1 hypothetical protein [Achromobacter sp. ACM01]
MVTSKKEPLTPGEELVIALKAKYGLKTDRALANHLDLTPAGLNVWRRWKVVTPKQILNVLARAERAAQKELHRNAIRPVVEFFKLDKVPSRHGTKFEIFDSSPTHPYLHGLSEELRTHHGVYVFFDSRGHAIYAGKARKQKLWKELNLAFNRDRKDVQTVKRVNHPSRRQPYKTNEEKQRQISSRAIPLHDMAAYVSAYKVVDEMVDGVEAMLVRSFANDLLNVRMERFFNGK